MLAIALIDFVNAAHTSDAAVSLCRDILPKVENTCPLDYFDGDYQ